MSSVSLKFLLRLFSIYFINQVKFTIWLWLNPNQNITQSILSFEPNQFQSSNTNLAEPKIKIVFDWFKSTQFKMPPNQWFKDNYDI